MKSKILTLIITALYLTSCVSSISINSENLNNLSEKITELHVFYEVADGKEYDYMSKLTSELIKEFKGRNIKLNLSAVETKNYITQTEKNRFIVSEANKHNSKLLLKITYGGEKTVLKKAEKKISIDRSSPPSYSKIYGYNILLVDRFFNKAIWKATIEYDKARFNYLQEDAVSCAQILMEKMQKELVYTN